MSIVLTRELLHFFMCVIELKGERERHSHTGRERRIHKGDTSHMVERVSVYLLEKEQVKKVDNCVFLVLTDCVSLCTVVFATLEVCERERGKKEEQV